MNLKDNAFVKTYLGKLDPIPTNLIPKGKLNADFKCVLFDIYGTLFVSDSGDIGSFKTPPARVNLLHKLIKRYGLPTDVDHLIRQYTSAIEASHQRSKAKGIQFPEVDITLIWEEILSRYGIRDSDRVQVFCIEFEMCTHRVYPMPGLKSCLENLRQRKLKMGIISNAQFYTPYLFNWFLDAGLADLGFDTRLLFFSYQQRFAKPSLELYQTALSVLNSIPIEAEEVLYIGNDMLNDIYPAKTIGFQTALFAGDKRSLRLREHESVCQHVDPDYIITHLDQLQRSDHS